MTNWAKYVTSHRLLNEHGLECLGAGQFEGVSQGFRDRRLDAYAVIYISEGAGQYADAVVGTREVVAPALIQVFPRRPHGYWSTSGWTENWMMFAGSMVAAYEGLDVLDRQSPVRALDGASLAEIPRLFASLRGVLGVTGWQARFRAATIAQEVLTTLLGSASEKLTERSVVSALQADSALRIGVDARAQRLGVSVSTMRSHVHAATGRTPRDLITETRLERACDLLIGSALPVHAVSRTVGYDDPAYFSRIFARRIGVSPSQFRKLHQR